MNKSVIKDPIWGEILLLKWEKVLLNTRAFNRLHGVLQNSNGYRVYPSARHSRFAHSLGTMHVATEICCGLFTNHFNAKGSLSIKKSVYLDAECSQVFLAECTSMIRQVKKGLTQTQKNSLGNFEAEFRIHPNLVTVLFVVRIAALLHDIGHLPYSHVFEHALENWFETGDERAIEFKSLFIKGGGAAHEQIGGWIMHFLAHQDLQTNDQPLLRRFISVAVSLLHEKATDTKKPRYPILKSIVSGVIDADRIDYIRRDGELSGFMRSGADYQRLFRNFIVSSCQDSPEDPDDVTYFVRPSDKAKSDFEKILWERYQEYSYVVGHHKVILFDEITKRLIRTLLVHGKLQAMLEGLKTLKEIDSLTVSRSADDDDLRKAVRELLELHCDDGYIDEKIKQLYSEYDKSDKSYDNKHLRKLVVAYCERRNLFTSAFKIDEHFWSIWNKLFKKPQAISMRSSLGRDPEAIADTIEVDAEVVEEIVFSDPRTKDLHIVIAKSQASFGLGFKSKDMKAYALGGLGSFLATKRDEMRPFNFWYVAEEGKSVNKKIILEIILENFRLPNGKENLKTIDA
jgi:HD superfamily phosphohydrolase